MAKTTSQEKANSRKESRKESLHGHRTGQKKTQRVSHSASISIWKDSAKVIVAAPTVVLSWRRDGCVVPHQRAILHQIAPKAWQIIPAAATGADLETQMSRPLQKVKWTETDMGPPPVAMGADKDVDKHPEEPIASRHNESKLSRRPALPAALGADSKLYKDLDQIRTEVETTLRNLSAQEQDISPMTPQKVEPIGLLPDHLKRERVLSL